MRCLIRDRGYSLDISCAHSASSHDASPDTILESWRSQASAQVMVTRWRTRCLCLLSTLALLRVGLLRSLGSEDHLDARVIPQSVAHHGESVGARHSQGDVDREPSAPRRDF